MARLLPAALLLGGLAISAQARASTRVAVVVDEVLDGETRGASDLEAALIDAVSPSSEDVVFVDPARAAAVREAAAGRALREVEVEVLVEPLDADVLVVGEVELAAGDAGFLKGVKTFEAAARLRVVAVGSGQILGALRERAVSSHYGEKAASARAVTALAERLAPELVALLAEDARYALELSLPVRAGATQLEAILSCIEAIPGFDDVEVEHAEARSARLALGSPESPRQLATRLEGAGCGLRVLGYADRSLRAELGPRAGAPVLVEGVRFERRGVRRGAWLADELPRLVLAELAGHPGLKADPARVRPGRGASEADALVVGSFTRRKDGLRIGARIVSSDGDEVFAAEQTVCPPERPSACALELGRALAETGAPAILAARGAAPRPARRAALRIEAVRVEPIFPARAGAYDARAPVGEVVIRNAGERPATDIEIRTALSALSARPSTSRVARLEPGDTTTAPLTLWLERDALRAHVSNRTLPVDVALSATVEGRRVVHRAAAAAVVYGKHAVDWAGGAEDVAAFIDPRSPHLEALARAARRAADPLPEHPLALPAALLEVGGRLEYARDAVNAFDPRAIDTVRFPSETWSNGHGDCDDLAVFHAALLEASGYPALLLLTPGHVLAAAGTKLDPSAAPRLSLDPDATLVHDGVLWVPFEATAASEGFRAAWRAAAERLRELRQRGQSPRIIEVRDAWTRRPPVQLASLSEPPPAPELAFEARVAEDLERLEERRERGIASLKRELEQSADPVGLNRLGVLLALAGQARSARAILERSLALDASAAAENNLGNLELLASGPPQALQRYRAALELAPERLGILLNAITAAYLGALEAPELQDELTGYVDRALSLDPEGVSRFLERLPGGEATPADSGARALGGLAALIRRRAPSAPPAVAAADAGRTVDLTHLLHWMR